MKHQVMIAGALALALAACGDESVSEVDAAAPAADATLTAIPESLAPFGDGYPNPGDPCHRLGESAATSNYLDDSAILVGCPSEASAEALGGSVIGNVEGVRLVSVSTGDANAGMSENGPATNETPVAKQVPIRGANSLESLCAVRVAKETGAKVIGTNRIEESEAAIDIYINVDGAAAPWRCLANRDGSISEVSFAGDEGGL